MFEQQLPTVKLASCLCLAILAAAPAGFAQNGNGYRGSDPNLRNFYMARQQIQIIDDSPIVTHSTNPAGGAGQGAAGATGAAPLPKASFSSYMQSMPQNMGPLPKTENGVPKAPPPLPKGFKGNAGKLKIKTAPVASGPKSYSSYKGYGGNVPAAAPSTYSEAPVSSSGGSSAERNVKGSVLHWSRSHRQGY